MSSNFRVLLDFSIRGKLPGLRSHSMHRIEINLLCSPCHAKSAKREGHTVPNHNLSGTYLSFVVARLLGSIPYPVLKNLPLSQLLDGSGCNGKCPLVIQIQIQLPVRMSELCDLLVCKKTYIVVQT